MTGELDPSRTAEDGPGGHRSAGGTLRAGYLSESYARAFGDHAVARYLPRSGGWMLERRVETGRPHAELLDAMGAYPLFCCSNWSALGGDLAELGARWVSVVLVTDPFAGTRESELEKTFDLVVPFKSHFVADLSLPISDFVSVRRLRQARKALASLEVEVHRGLPVEPTLSECWNLYADLLRRRGVTGIRAFSRTTFECMARVPGAVFLVARAAGRAVGMHFEYAVDGIVYGHLAAYDAEGYRRGAAAALHLAEIEHFLPLARWIDWGGTPGLASDLDHGLATFKRGFSSHERPTYLCGKILDEPTYRTLCADREPTSYFPAYREGELG